MAKKQSKHSRAARRNALEDKPEVDVEDLESSHHNDSRAKVLEEIALKELRSGGNASAKPPQAIPAGMDELTALSMGLHPDQSINPRDALKSGRVVKPSAKKNKRNMKKQQRAEMVKDMLNEKIDQARVRHKMMRTYRSKEEENEAAEATQDAEE